MLDDHMVNQQMIDGMEQLGVENATSSRWQESPKGLTDGYGGGTFLELFEIYYKNIT